jgi:mono/diheme cytochrome c family protein
MVCFLGVALAALVSACGSPETAPFAGNSTGGASTGGASTGGASTGGASTGGASTGGGSTGGGSTGGASTGGASTGGASTGGASTGGAGGTAGASTTLTGDVTRGARLYTTTTSSGCGSCHGTAAAGGLGPNISSSVSAGIGGWTQAEFRDTLRLRKTKDGRTLCDYMPLITPSILDDQGIADIYAFLKSTAPNDTKARGFSKGTFICP